MTDPMYQPIIRRNVAKKTGNTFNRYDCY